MLKNEYIPIDCAFHDLLLDRITRKTAVNIKYVTKYGIRDKKIQLKDVFTKDKEEFLVMQDGEKIRLDQIISVDNNILNKDSKCKFQ